MASVPVIEKRLYLKLISHAGETTGDVSSFRSPADKFIIYRPGAHRKKGGFPLMPPYQYNLPPSPSPLYLTHRLLSLFPFFSVLRNNLQPICLDTDNASPFSQVQLLADLHPIKKKCLKRQMRTQKDVDGEG